MTQVTPHNRGVGVSIARSPVLVMRGYEAAWPPAAPTIAIEYAWR
jgi:hypothetical protein